MYLQIFAIRVSIDLSSTALYTLGTHIMELLRLFNGSETNDFTMTFMSPKTGEIFFSQKCIERNNVFEHQK